VSHDDNLERKFQELAGGLSGLVGQGEIEAREFLGNEQFEHMVNTAKEYDLLNMEKERAQTFYLRSLGGLFNGITLLAFFAAFMGLAWSVYYWIVG